MGTTAQVARAVRDLGSIPGINVMVVAGGVTPEFLRYPRRGEHCPITGLSASSMRDIIKGSNGQVKVRSPRKRGNLVGVVLIDHDSLISYLHSLPETTEAEPQTADS